MVRQGRKCSASVLRVLFAALMVLASCTVARAAYWNVFNIEGDTSLSAQFVTYATLGDMLADTNRLGVFVPNAFDVGQNIVGSGAEIQQEVPVPEPATLAILMASILMLALLSRRRGGPAASGHSRGLRQCAMG